MFAKIEATKRAIDVAIGGYGKGIGAVSMIADSARLNYARLLAAHPDPADAAHVYVKYAIKRQQNPGVEQPDEIEFVSWEHYEKSLVQYYRRQDKQDQRDRRG